MIVCNLTQFCLINIQHPYASRLDLEYVDLYLMHSPIGGKTLETWDAMIELKEQGLVRYIKLCL